MRACVRASHIPGLGTELAKPTAQVHEDMERPSVDSNGVAHIVQELL